MTAKSSDPSRRVPYVLAGLTALSVWAFASVAEEVIEGETPEFDTTVLGWFRDPDNKPWGPTWLEEAMRDITGLGGFTVLGFVRHSDLSGDERQSPHSLLRRFCNRGGLHLINRSEGAGRQAAARHGSGGESVYRQLSELPRRGVGRGLPDARPATGGSIVLPQCQSLLHRVERSGDRTGGYLPHIFGPTLSHRRNRRLGLGQCVGICVLGRLHHALWTPAPWP